MRRRPGTEAWVTFTCRDAATVDNGDSFAACVEAVCASPQVVGVGVNCTEPHLVPALLRAARRAAGPAAVLVCYPNSGECYDMTGAESTWTKVFRKPRFSSEKHVNVGPNSTANR